MIPEFTYNEMRVRKRYSSEALEYAYIPYPAGFLSVYVRNSTHFPNTNLETGWKFHISFDQDQNNDGANMAKGWDIVNTVLIEHHCPEWKIIANPRANVGTGKKMTIFVFKDHKTVVEWQQILQEIEQRLNEANIRPDPAGFSNNDKRIPGSQFITYRNDSDLSGNYLPESRATSYNDSGQVDPYDALTFVPPNNSPQCCILV